MAAAAARTWWAAHRRRWRAPTPSSVRDGKSTKAARRASFLLVLLAAATIVCAAIGLVITQLDDSRLAAERHAALRLALDEFRAVFGAPDHFDTAQLRLIERRAALKNLRFDADPIGPAGREAQSLHDAQGRIVGWFSWTVDRGLVRAMNRLWILVGLTGAALALCGIIGRRAGRRLAGSLARSTETVRRLTHEDPLTGLPNHRVMLERLNEALASRRSETVVFALIDLDAFREINDTLGRAGGDAMIAGIAEHVKAGLPAGVLLGRFEDDEFAVMMRGEDACSAGELAASLRALLSAPAFATQTWHLSAGIGVAQAPQDGTTADELTRRAGLALGAAEREGRGIARCFEPPIESEQAERRFILRELESAVSLQALDVHYQPILAADGNSIVGVEALLRWTHATRGAIAPSVFIPLAEHSGVMPQLGEFVLRRALTDGAGWPDVFVAVNLSPMQVRDPGLIDLVGAVLAESGIAASRVVLEFTEGILIDDPQQTRARLEALRALGVGIALDDFGAGYSSLSYLQKFPFDRLKIDRVFVASLGTAANTGAIIHSIVTLGHALGMKVLAEGVETDEQRVLLRLAGCDEMQGYLFAKAGPAAEIDKVLARPLRLGSGQAAASAR